MNIFRKYRKSFLGLGIGIFFIAVLPFSGLGAKSDPQTDMNLVILVRDKLRLNYVKKNVDEQELVYGAIRGMLESLDDPYTRFMPPKNFKEMKVRMDGQFYGVGIHIGMRKKMLTVISPIDGTPAHDAGLKPQDMIITINGESAEGISLVEAVSKIRGPKGSTVVLGIEREGKDKPFDVPIIRDKIEISSVDKVEVFEDTVGYARLTTFENRKATSELKKAILKLKGKGMKSLILDLRFNGGGLLENAINISGLFINKGDVVHTVDRDGSRRTRTVNGRALFFGPMIVLINEGSASASEILAGAIKDHDRGLILGKNSFGKASV
ncbi:MAG: PDZ domain-containing protein, partial [Candidatus Margulisbacteria bacterium]|nr:PDZ domain-containing protein [Candidatus Margulisiibacteriota bacterium]